VSNRRKARSPQPGAFTILSRQGAVSRIAAAFADRTAYIVAGDMGALATVMERISEPGAVCFFDQGMTTVLAVKGEPITRMPEVLALLPAPIRAVAIATMTVPKTVPARVLGAAVGQEVPADGSQDVLMVRSADASEQVWPVLLIEAIGRSDPESAMAIAAADQTGGRLN
jgi:hypothetical protein